MNKVKRYLSRVMSIQRSFFSECGSEIAFRNLQLMRTTCYAGVVVYLAYYLITALFFKNMLISPVYGLIVPVLIAFILYAKKELAAQSVHVGRVQRATLLLSAVLMLDIIIMSVFPYPDAPFAYYPLFLIMVPVVLILPAYQHLILTAASLALYYWLVLTFKTAAFRQHELFEAATAAVFSVIAIVCMTQFRVQSDSLKSKYYLLSRQDELTGAVNKTAGVIAFQEYVARMRRGEQCAMLFVDMDSFKGFNDTYGHMEGDRLLKKIGETLIALCRSDDIVCRFGGDEFLILLKKIRTREDAARTARRIIDEIGKIDPREDPHLTCSIGICFCDCKTVGCDELIRKADAALYHAKKKGKNRYVMSA